MRSNARVDRELDWVIRQINDETGTYSLGERGSTKYEVAFAVYHALQWARGKMVKPPGDILANFMPRKG